MEKKKWTTVIDPTQYSFSIKLREVVQYKDLIKMFYRRYFVTAYKQTVLGPAWLIITPLMSALMLTLVFGNIANISTDGSPKFLFYYVSSTVWTLFSSSLMENSSLFLSNAGIFGKVYFPRITVPIATILQLITKFLIQFGLYLVFFVYYILTGFTVPVTPWLLVLPMLVVMISVLGSSLGIIISSMTTKYRDLRVFVGFFMQLWMYISPVVYPATILKGNLRWIIMLNPVAPIIETFRSVCLGNGRVNIGWLGYSMAVTVISLYFGLKYFDKTEKTFIDTV